MELYFPLILDGATGTQLQKRGYTGEVCAEQWVLDHPEVIKEIQKAYVKAGSNIVYAPTFSANQIKFKENGIENKVEEYNTRLVQLSKEAVQGKALVAGDMAPLGKFLVPFGDMHFEEMYEIYLQQAAALEKAGVDLFVIETMMSVPEARAAYLAVKAVSKKPVFVSFTATEEGRTISGSDIEAVLEIFQSMGVNAFGLNCSVGPKGMVEQIKKISPITQVPLIAKPNAGMPEIIDGKTIYRCSNEEYTNCMQELADHYVALFGGCCGSTEQHIQAIADESKRLTISKPEKREENVLYVASEKKLFKLNADICGDVVFHCEEDLAEQLSEFEGDIITIRVEKETDIEILEMNQYAINKPCIIDCDDEVLLEKALRVYQGKCLYQGNIRKDILQKFSQKYGVIY